MRSSVAYVVALAVLAGCRVESGYQRSGERQRGGQDTATAAGAASPGAGHGVFNRRSEQVAPGITRVTVSAIVPIEPGQDTARAMMERLLQAERQRDSSVAAIRILAYLPPAAGHGAQQAPLVPLAFLDWTPAAGWDRLSAETARQPYRVVTTFVHDAATMGMTRMPPARGGAPPTPRDGQMPPGHPAPRPPQ